MKNPGEKSNSGANENFYRMTDWDTLSQAADEFNAQYGENTNQSADDEAYQKKLEAMAQRDESFDALSNEQMSANETNSRVTDENGNLVERSSSMFEVYPRQQGESSKDYGERLKEVNRGRRLEYSVQADSPELRRKLEDMSQRDSSYDALSDAEISANETNTGINARGEEYTRNSSTFDRYPRQQGESSADYGSRIRWMNQMEKIIADNPQQDGESRDDYSARLESLGAVSLEDFRENENTAAEDDARREKLREIVREHPRNEGENTFDYAQRIYDETGVKIGDHINTGERPSFVDNAMEQSSEQDIEQPTANQYHMKTEKPENQYHLKTEGQTETPAEKPENMYHLKTEGQTETPAEKPENKYRLRNEQESVVDWAKRNEMPAGAEAVQKAPEIDKSYAEQLERRKLAFGALASGQFHDLLARDGIRNRNELAKLSTEEAESLLEAYMAEINNKANQAETPKAESVAETGNRETLLNYLAYEENHDLLDKMGITKNGLEAMSNEELGLLIDKMNASRGGEVVNEQTSETSQEASAEQTNETVANAAETKELSRAEKLRALASKIGKMILSFLKVDSRNSLENLSDEEVDSLNARVEKASAISDEKVADSNIEADTWEGRLTQKKWNKTSEAERRLMLSGQFDAFDVDAAGRVADVLDYVDLGIIDKDPEDIQLPENDYQFETSQAALGKFESVVDLGGNLGETVTKVEFSEDEIEALMYRSFTKIENGHAEVDTDAAEKAFDTYMENVEAWNGASDEERMKYLNYDFNVDEVRDDPLYRVFRDLTIYSPLQNQAQLIGTMDEVREARKMALLAASEERKNFKNAAEAADSFVPIANAEDVRNINVSNDRIRELNGGREYTEEDMDKVRRAIMRWNELDSNSKADILKGEADFSNQPDLDSAMTLLRENGLIPSVETGTLRDAEADTEAEPAASETGEAQAS